LTLLNQGEETSVAYKKLIMEFADVWTGIRLRSCRRAMKNLRDAVQRLEEEERLERQARNAQAGGRNEHDDHEAQMAQMMLDFESAYDEFDY